MIKVLWITNALLPDAIVFLTGKGECNSTGSWIYALTKNIIKTSEISLYVASTSMLVGEFKKLSINGVTHYILPKLSDEQKYCSKYEKYWKTINYQLQPDVVHIHGTERPLGLSYVKACGNKRVVASIQGLVSDIKNYYLAGLTFPDIVSNITIHDILRNSHLYAEQHKMERCGEYEKVLLKSIHHIIGRTSWDRAHCYAINNRLIYHFNNETLRSEFYEGCWSYENCIPHSLFLTQAGYPLKGTHQLLKALPLVLSKYPDVKVKIAGNNMIACCGFKSIFYTQSYGKYLKKIIRKLHLEDIVEFIGPQNASGMKENLLLSNVFVSPSSIENSPNSICEAQLLGIPIVASFVGGVPDFIPSKDFGLTYRFEDVEMLAQKICECFETSKMFDSTLMVETARNRHNEAKNLRGLIEIYKYIADENN